jgi:hypothetical protein
MDASTKSLVDIRSDLSSIDEKQFKQRNKHLWKRVGGRQHFYECTFEIRVNIGPSDILFELCKSFSTMLNCRFLQSKLTSNRTGFNGYKLSEDKSIQVQWQPVELSASKSKPLSPRIAELDAGPSLPALVAEMPTSPSRFLPDFRQFSMNGHLKSVGNALKSSA